MKWLDLKPYGMKLVIARDRSGQKQHTLVLAGPGLRNLNTQALLTQLGFSQNEQFSSYWSRSYVGFRLTELRSLFPNAQVVDLPVEEISPAIKHEMKQRQGAGAQDDRAGQPRNRSTGIAARAPARGVDAGNPRTDGALGPGSTQPDVRSQPLDDAPAPRERGSSRVSPEPGRDSGGPSAEAGGAVQEKQPTPADSNAPQQNGVAQPGEVVRGRVTDEQRERADRVAPRRVQGNNDSLTTATDAQSSTQARTTQDATPNTVSKPFPAEQPQELSPSELAQARDLYTNGISSAGERNPFDEALEPEQERTPPGFNLENPDTDSDNYQETREAFDRRDYDTAFALYQKGAGSNGVDRDEFMEAFAGLSGGKASSLYLTNGERRELHRLGLRDSLVEHYALHYAGEDDNLAYAFDLATQHDALIAAAISRRITSDDGLAGQLSALGFEHVPDDEPSTGAPEHLYRAATGESLVVVIGKDALLISGYPKGQVLPAFEIRDELDTSVSDVGTRIRSEVVALWPSLGGTPANETPSSASSAPNNADSSPGPISPAQATDIDTGSAVTEQNESADQNVDLGAEPPDSFEVSAGDVEEAFSTNRVWNGATLQHMLDVQGYTPSTTSIFAALKAVEEGQGLSESNKRTLASFQGWGVEGDKLRVDHAKSHANFSGNSIAASLGMTPADFQRAYLDNRLESYYTPPQLCDSIWKGVMRAGISPGGKYLDAGCGAAAFFAAAPDKVQCHGTLIGVEADPISARLAAVVAPDARIIHSKYEQAVLARDFDAVVGNVPFGSSKIHDANYPDAHHIHDYFILRSLDQLKSGGIAAVITSAGSLDKVDETVRKEMLKRADLIGAVRLPREAFSHLQAMVATDILFLQRRPEGTKASYDYTEAVRVSLDEASGTMVEDEAGTEYINRYYLDNPEDVLGKYEMTVTAFGPKPALVNKELQPLKIIDRFNALQGLVDARIESILPEGIANRSQWEPAEGVDFGVLAAGEEDWSEFERIEWREGNFVGDNVIADNGRIIEIVDIAPRFDSEGVLIGHEHIVAETSFSGKRIATMEAYIGLRDACRELISAQLNGSDVVLSAAQDKAKELYHSFTKAHGPINANKNVRIFGDDAGSAEVCALEVWDDDENKVIALADTFEKRVIGAELVPNIETAEDAYYHSLDIKGEVDFEFMAELLGQDVDQIKEALIGDLVFFNPQSHAYEPQHLYLSGNVVHKLAEAEQALATMPQLAINVEKLREAQPSPIPFEDISFRLGVGWIPERDIESFVGELFGQQLSPRDLSVRYTPEIGSWSVEVSSSFKSSHETRRTTLHGTKDCAFERLLEMQLNAQKPTHYDKVDGKTFVNDERTMASRTKQEDIEAAFRTWVGRDVDRIHRYTEMYNANCNTIALPKIDGSRITFPGLASTWHPRQHQNDMAAMSLMGYNCMAAHCVGAGKTFEMVAIAIKLKQVGKCNKPSIAVPNHMLGQITREAKQMFPAARILQVTADDLKGAARQRFLARARNNDWDLVVFTHGMMNRIQAPLEIQTRELIKNIDKIEAKIADTEGRVRRQLEASAKSQISKLESLRSAFDGEQRKNGVLTIDQLGIDLINIDETHLYKNLAINSNMDVLGVTRGGSQRAENYKMLAEYMRDLHGRSFGINAFTGTPVANTICELYVHGSVLRPELFSEQGIHDFDEWAKRFGDVVSALEPLPEGGGFRVNERFARFVNLPEMIKLFRSFADVKNPSDLNLPVPHVEQIIESVDQSDFQKDFMKHLAIRATKVRTGKVKPHEDNMLAVATAGRKAALDMRLVSPLIPDDASMKLDLVAKNVHNEWEAHSEVNAAQIVFMDQGTPKKDGAFSTYQKLRDLLVEKGIPDQDIAFVHQAKNDVEKEALFEKVRKGEVRVLIGSTEKMGVGTNVQERLVALHDVDCPWRPSDIAQRRGRIERQGNKFFESVRNYRYTTKDSFDLFMWGGNQRKANFIAQALGDPTQAGREVSEDIDLGYAEVMAVTTGNPKIREKVEVDDQVIKMERRRRAWQSDLYSKASEGRRLRSDMKHVQRQLDAETLIAEALPKGVGDRKVIEIKGAVSKLESEGSMSVLRATEAGEAVRQRAPIAEARLMKHNKGFEPLGMSIGNIDLVLDMDISTKQSFVRGMIDGDFLPFRIGISKSAQSMGAMIRELYDTDFRTNKLTREMQRLQASYELVKDFNLEAEWPQESEFVELKSRQRELNTWFAAQDFNSVDSVDPFLERMERLEQEDARRLKMSELESEIAANGDLAMLDRGFDYQSEAPQPEIDVEKRSSLGGMRMG